MAWTTPRTWVAGEVPAAATFNTHVRDNLAYLYALLSVTRYHVDTTDGANSGSGETTLFTKTLDAGLLAADGMAIEVVGFGTTANNSNSKAIKLYFGATVVESFSFTTAQVDWTVYGRVVRTGAATQKALGKGQRATSNTMTYTTPAETLSGGIEVKITGTGVSTNDIVGRGFEILLIP